MNMLWICLDTKLYSLQNCETSNSKTCNSNAVNLNMEKYFCFPFCNSNIKKRNKQQYENQWIIYFCTKFPIIIIIIITMIFIITIVILAFELFCESITVTVNPQVDQCLAQEYFDKLS